MPYKVRKEQEVDIDLSIWSSHVLCFILVTLTLSFESQAERGYFPCHNVPDSDNLLAGSNPRLSACKIYGQPMSFSPSPEHPNTVIDQTGWTFVCTNQYGMRGCFAFSGA